MRNFKIYLSVFFIFLIQTVIISRIHILGAVPSLVLSFTVCVMMLENEFQSALIIGIVCAALMGALSGRSFAATTLCYTYSSIAVFAARKKLAHIGSCIKAVAWTGILSVIFELVALLLSRRLPDSNMLLTCCLTTAVFNMVMTALLYQILKRTIYKEEKKKKLLTI